MYNCQDIITCSLTCLLTIFSRKSNFHKHDKVCLICLCKNLDMCIEKCPKPFQFHNDTTFIPILYYLGETYSQKIAKVLRSNDIKIVSVSEHFFVFVSFFLYIMFYVFATLIGTSQFRRMIRRLCILLDTFGTFYLVL